MEIIALTLSPLPLHPSPFSSGASISNEDFKQYFDWLVGKLKSPTPVQLETAIQALMNLLLVPDIRIKFSETPEGVQRSDLFFFSFLS